MSTKASTKKATTKKAPAEKKRTKKAEAKEQTAEPVEKKERKRRDVNKESVDIDFAALQTRIESEISRLRESTEKVRGIKFLRSINKALKTLHSDTKRVMKLKKKNNRKKTVVSGFLKPIRISPELAAFTGWDVNGTYSRVNVTKFICEYIKTNKLYNEKDKRKILCDDKLKKLLNYDPANPGLDKDGNPAELNYFRLQKHLKDHFIRIETPAGESPATEQPKTEKKVAEKSKKATEKTAPKASAAKKSKKPREEEDEEADA